MLSTLKLILSSAAAFIVSPPTTDRIAYGPFATGEVLARVLGRPELVAGARVLAVPMLAKRFPLRPGAPVQPRLLHDEARHPECLGSRQPVPALEYLFLHPTVGARDLLRGHPGGDGEPRSPARVRGVAFGHPPRVEGAHPRHLSGQHEPGGLVPVRPAERTNELLRYPVEVVRA